jgi:hypothetical protein
LYSSSGLHISAEVAEVNFFSIVLSLIFFLYEIFQERTKVITGTRKQKTVSIGAVLGIFVLGQDDALV